MEPKEGQWSQWRVCGGLWGQWRVYGVNGESTRSVVGLWGSVGSMVSSGALWGQ